MTILMIHHTFGVSWINIGPESKKTVYLGCMSYEPASPAKRSASRVNKPIRAL
jgi:hypothetical protein